MGSQYEDERARFEWEGNFPETVRDMIREVLTRPASENVSPLYMVQQINQALLYAPPPTPRELARGKKSTGPGTTKIMDASKCETEEETTRRKEAQKQCKRLILPRRDKETPDAFLRRLDCHVQAPEANVLPQACATEDFPAFVKRIVAIREIDIPGYVVLPKNAKESLAEFELRLKACKACKCVVLPRGTNETPDDFKKRMELVPKSPVTIMAKSNDEPQAEFVMRCTISKDCQYNVVVHPYDSTREDHEQYADRLLVQKLLVEQIVEPGNFELINFEAERLKPKPKPEARSSVQPNEDGAPAGAPAPEAAGAKPKAKTKAQLEEEEMEAAAKAEAEEKKKKAEEEGEEEKPASKPSSRRGSAVPGAVKLGCQHLVEEEKKSLADMDEETVELATVGFMALKKMMIERGIPKDQVDRAAGKNGLKMLAEQHECKIKFT